MGTIATGIPNLDTVLGGGLREASLVVVAGGPGTGKTVFVQQIASHYARQGGKVLYVTALSEPHSALVAHLSGFTFFDRSLLGDRIKLINVFPVARQGLGAVTTTVIRTLKDERISFLIFDGFHSLRDIHADEREVRAFSYELVGTLSAIRVTALVTGELGIVESDATPEIAIADGLVVLRSQWSGLRTRRTLEVIKLRGAEPLQGPHSMEITERGLNVYPRPEAVYSRPVGMPPPGRTSSGLSELDAMLNGGLPRGSSTLITGGPGVGKTLLGLHYASAGVREGESTVLVSFQETPEHLLAKAERAGLDVAGTSERRFLTLLYYPGIEVDPDRVVWEMWGEVEAAGARRVVIDGMSHLEREVGENRVLGFMTALIAHLRAKGVTVCFTREVGRTGEPLLQMGSLPLSAVSDNIITMRMVESRGELRYVLAVVKMRDSAHEHIVREYTIGERGLRLGARFDGS